MAVEVSNAVVARMNTRRTTRPLSVNRKTRLNLRPVQGPN